MYQGSLIRKVLWIEYNITPVNCGTTWESIELEDGIEKPPKDEFNEKVSNFVKTTNVLTLRKERNKRLAECDWTQLPNVPLPDTKKYEWETYRQALRDLPANTEDPVNPVWPVPPE